MKLSVLFCACACLLLFGCTKEKSLDSTDPDQNPSAANGSIQAKIGGSVWTANSVSGASRVGGYINITGRSSDKKIFTITLSDSGVHKYTITPEPLNVAVWLDSSEVNPVPYTTNAVSSTSPGGGEVVITAIDETKKTMSGTFSIKVYRYDTKKTITISEGRFTNLPYISSPNMGTPGGTASVSGNFKVKINGTSWHPAAVMASKTPIMNMIGIAVMDNDGGRTITISLPATTVPGTYGFGPMMSDFVGQYRADANTASLRISDAGILTILEHNTSKKLLRGTFEFEASDFFSSQNKVQISEGSFSVNYQ